MKDTQATPRLSYYRLSVTDTLAELSSSEAGLSETEARERRRHAGPNRIQYQDHAPSMWRTVGRHYRDPLVLMLLASAALSLIVRDFRLAVIVLLVAITNASISYLIGRKSKNVPDSPVGISALRTKVQRGGDLYDIPSTKLVPGDVIYVVSGDTVPADARIIHVDSLTTTNLAITGDSRALRNYTHALSADVSVSNRHNMLYAGTTVTHGSGYAVVTNTGMHTELGRAVKLYSTVHTDTVSPLQRELRHITIRLAQGGLIGAAIVVFAGLQTSISTTVSIVFGISVLVALVPGGLLAEIAVILTQTASRMAHDHTPVAKLTALDTLDAVNTLIVDTAGILTMHEMTATHVIIGRTEYTVSGRGYALNGAICNEAGRPISGQALKDLRLFFEAGSLTSTATIKAPDAEHDDWYAVGDPTEGALITLARKAGIEPTQLTKRFAEHKQHAYDMVRKRTTSVRELDGQLYAFTVGTPASVMACATSLWDHGHTRRLTAVDKQFFTDYAKQRTAANAQTLAFAYRELPKNFNPSNHDLEDAEQNLTFLGVVTVAGTAHDELPNVITAGRSAHIPISFFTDDVHATAVMLDQVGLTDDATTIMTDNDIAQHSTAEILRLLQRGNVLFSCLDPETKLRIVRIARSNHNIVAVAGSGVYTLPAIAQADIGIGMGLSGVTTQATGDMTLASDKLSTLVTAIRHSRLSFQNITHAVRCALTDSASELVTVLISLAAMVIWGIPAALTVVQLLAISLIAQLFPIAALGWDPATSRLMRQKPRMGTKHIITRASVSQLIGYGLLAGALTYTNYVWFFVRHHISPLYLGTSAVPYMQASILAYVTLVLCQFVNLLLVRSQGQLFSKRLWHNKKLLVAFTVSAFSILNIVYNPLLQPLFNSAGLTGWDWLTALGAASLYTTVRLLHMHTKATSYKELLRKHSPEKIHHHLQHSKSLTNPPY